VDRSVCGFGHSINPVSNETGIGRNKGWICYEHLMLRIRMRMIEQGEDFHVAAIFAAFSLHRGPRLDEADAEGQFFWGPRSRGDCALSLRRQEEVWHFPLLDMMNLSPCMAEARPWSHSESRWCPQPFIVCLQCLKPQTGRLRSGAVIPRGVWLQQTRERAEHRVRLKPDELSPDETGPGI